CDLELGRAPWGQQRGARQLTVFAIGRRGEARPAPAWAPPGWSADQQLAQLGEDRALLPAGPPEPNTEQRPKAHEDKKAVQQHQRLGRNTAHIRLGRWRPGPKLAPHPGNKAECTKQYEDAAGDHDS